MSAAPSVASLAGPTFEMPAEPRYPSLLAYGCAVLNEHHHERKASLTAEAAAFHSAGKLPLYEDDDDSKRPVPPSKPNRPTHLTVVEPKAMPPARKGVEHHEWNKLRLIHSLAHIENYAIDLSWDVLVRFATSRSKGTEATNGVAMPPEFYADWLRIANEEARHYTIWARRLVELGAEYGSHHVHEGLWQSAGETSHSLAARLAVVHCVHEARGLDQAPRMLSQLETYGDKASCRLLEFIERDELTHVASGLRWFKYLCAEAAEPVEPIPRFHAIVRENFRGSLLPPFNTAARAQCGFTEEWYLPLAVKKERPTAVVPAAAESGAAAAETVQSKGEEEKKAAAVSPTGVAAATAQQQQ